MAITDHNDVRSQSAPGFGQGLLGIPAYENSLQGHAQMLGATRVYDNGDSSAAAVSRLARELRGAGGVFQVNHPAEGATADQLDWELAYSVVPDTVEAWNISPLYQPPLPSASDNDGAIRYWEGWLDRGKKVGATGGATTTTWPPAHSRARASRPPGSGCASALSEAFSRGFATGAPSSPTSRRRTAGRACSWRPTAIATGATRPWWAGR